MSDFSNKRHDEIEVFGFDFGPRMGNGAGSIASVVFSMTVLTGIDPSPQSMLIGAPSIGGTIVRQRFGGGVPGVLYRVTATVTTTAGLVMVESASLMVV